MNEAAFVGRFGPLMQHVLKLPDVPSQTIKVYPVLVEQAFRGVDAGSTIYVHTWEALEPSPTGRQYLVYGSFNFIVRDVVSPASLESLIPIEQAETHLAFLTSSESRLETTGRVFGVLQQGSPFDTSDRRPLAGILLHVHVGDFLTETTSDANGRFDVGGLPEGFFKIEPELPSQLTTAHFGGGTVRAGGCVPTTVLVQWNGIIRGRITRFDQSPVRGPVDLLSVQQPRSGSGRRNDAFEREGRSQMSDANGAFEFTVVPPGDYVVGINLRRPPSPGLPYVPTYYPGANALADATVVHVSEGTVHDGIDLVMPAALGRGRLVLSVETPPGGVVSACVAASGEYRQRAPGEPIVIDVIDGRHYRLRLHIEGAAGTHWESDILEVNGRAGVQELSVAAFRPARPHPNGFSCGAGGASEP